MSEISAQQPIYKAPTLEPRTREQLKKLQTKQMIAFFGLGAVAVASGLAARRAVLTRRCTYFYFITLIHILLSLF